jgi:hypothetical protein
VAPLVPVGHRRPGRRRARGYFYVGSRGRPAPLDRRPPEAWDDAETRVFLDQFAEPERVRASVQLYRSFQLYDLSAMVLGHFIVDERPELVRDRTRAHFAQG